jgi:hypothetical protein
MYKVLADKIKIPCVGGIKTIYMEVSNGRIIEPQHPSFQKEFDGLVEKGLIEKVQEKPQAEKTKTEKEPKTVI